MKQPSKPSNKNMSTKDILISFISQQEVFNNEVRIFMTEQRGFNKDVIKRLDNIEKRLERIENTPTVKRELEEMDKQSKQS